MKSKKYIVSVIALLLSCKAMACYFGGYADPVNHYLFFLGYPSTSCCSNYYQEWRTKYNKLLHDENVAFWHKYTGKKVSAEEVEKAIYSGEKPSGKYAFYEYLIKLNDTVAINYWNVVNCDYNSVLRWERSVWYYPTKEDEEQLHSEKLPYEIDINSIAHCPNRDIRNRYALQLMRMAFSKEDYKLVTEVWNKYGKKIPASALRTHCKSYYAGAMQHLGHKTEAAIAFAEIEYYNYWLHYDVNVVKTVYQHQPNCKSLEFIVQQIVNQHFDDCYGWNKKSRNYQKQKSDAFNSLADFILTDGKSKKPALWKSAQAAFAYTNGDRDLAFRLVQQADSLKGTKNVKENIRMMRLLCLASDTTKNDTVYENDLLPDLRWLVAQIRKDQKTNKEGFSYDADFEYEDVSNFAQHRAKIMRRTVLLEIVQHFNKKGMPQRSLAYLDMYSNLINVDVDYWDKSDYATPFFVYADTTNVENVKQHVTFLKSGGESDMDKFLISNSSKNYTLLCELIGTKYMRKEMWNTAIVYLRLVPEKFLKSQNIEPYLSSSNPFREQWITSSKQGKYSLAESPWKEYHDNPTKLQFCKTMKKLKKLSSNGKDAATRAEARYAYTVGLYQATLGKNWSLTRYAKGYVNIYSLENMYYTPSRRIVLHINKLLDNALAVAGKNDTIIIDKCYAMKYSIVGDLARYYIPANYDWNNYERYKQQLEKQSNLKSHLERNNFEVWGTRREITNIYKYVEKTFCDSEEDHKPQKKKTQTHTIYMPVNGRIYFEC